MTSSNSWSLRLFRDGDEEGMLEVFSAAFGAWPPVDIAVPPVEHLRWKLHGPGGAPPYHAVAEDRGKIVGVRVFLVQEAKVGERILTVRHPVDACVAPAYQELGIMGALRRYQHDAIAGAFDFQISLRSGNPLITKLQRRQHEKNDTFGNPIDVLVHSKAATPPRLPVESLGIRPAARFDERIDMLFEEAARPFQFIVARKHQYLNWRYTDPRAGRFTIRLAEQTGRLVGYSVLTLSHGRGFIADLLTVPEHPQIVAALLDDAIEILQAKGAETVECWLPRYHPYRASANSCGFTEKRRTLRMEYRSLRALGDVAFLNTPRAPIHITAGDADLV